MRILLNLCVIFSLALITGGCHQKDQSKTMENQKHVLIFSKTAEYRHGSIETGTERLQNIGAELGITTEHSEDASLFTDSRLASFDLIVFMSTSGDILNSEQQAAFVRYMKNGGHFMGIHAASDTEKDWPWYNGLVGAYFKNHPEIQEAKIHVLDEKHISCRHLPEYWIRTGEWYNFYSFQPGLKILLNLDESSYEGGENGPAHPLAWCHEYEGGRSFYTGIGHTIESFSEPLFINHLKGGVRWCLGL